MHFGARRLGVGRKGGLAVLAIACAGFELWGQTQVLVRVDDEAYPVVAMDGQEVILQLPDGRERVAAENVTVSEAPMFTDGAVHILRKDAMMGQDYGSNFGTYFFRFVAEVDAERDFEDCFILFAISPESGDPTYVMREIPDISAQATDRISVTMPVNPGFGGGRFAYKIYSKGEEIEIVDPEQEISIRNEAEESNGSAPESNDVYTERERPRTSRAGASAEPAEVLKAAMPEFPQELIGVLQGGYAELMYSIDESGKVMELLDIRADHPALVPAAIDCIVRTRYQPGRLDGAPVVTTLKQRFFFNEFASFPEELEIVPYPSLRDRHPQAVYYPVPKAEKSSRGEVKVELVVDALGRVRSARPVEGGDPELGQRAAEAAMKWIFLPGVEDGFPVSQKIVIPIAFKENSST